MEFNQKKISKAPSLNLGSKKGILNIHPFAKAGVSIIDYWGTYDFINKSKNWSYMMRQQCTFVFDFVFDSVSLALVR